MSKIKKPNIMSNELVLMNDERHLPASLEDLAQFVLVGRDKLAMVRAGIKALDKLDVAEGVRRQKKEEAQMLAEALLDAEVRIGEILAKMPKASGKHNNRGNQYQSGKSSTAGTFSTKEEAVSELGFDRKQVHRFQTLAANKDLVEEVKQAAREDDDLPTRTAVLQLAKERDKQVRVESKIEELKSKAAGFNSLDVQIINEPFQSGIARMVKDETVDLILTDPPYPAEFLPLWEDMFEMAERVLKPSKFLVAYANHQNLDKIFRLKNELIYYWTFKLDFTMKPMAKGRNLIATWKPVLIFQKTPFKKMEATIEDVVKENTKFSYDERDMHDLNWAQSIGKFEYLIEKFSDPNDLIIEPFAGTGTTLIAAQRMGRKCIGYEVEEKYIDLIKGRLTNG